MQTNAVRFLYAQAKGAERCLHAVEAVKELGPAEMAHPGALKPLLRLLACGVPQVRRLVVGLLAALVACGPRVCNAIRCLGFRLICVFHTVCFTTPTLSRPET